MHDFPNAILLIANAAVVAVAAWMLVQWWGPGLRGPLEPVLAWGLAVITLVAGAGVLLGALGWLGSAGFFITHGAVLAAMGWGRRARRWADRAALAGLLAAWREFFRRRDFSAGLGLLLLVGLIGLIGLAACAQPVVYDALTYRLPRIGQWLQDGRIGVVASDEPRINYMPVVPDLVMAWFVTATRAGFNLSAVAQALGGVLTVGATVGLARQAGLGHKAALGAGLLVLGLANVAPQFTSVHTDLFTTGVFSAAVYLWLAALRRGEGSVWGGLGAGLALGSKGTLFYFAPGALFWIGWLAWRHPLRWTQWSRTVLAACASLAVFLGPVLVRNWQAYGGPLGPAEHVQMHHGHGNNLAGELEKLGLNLQSSLAQVFEPNSQPPWWRGPARWAGEALARDLPEHDTHTLEDISRRGTLLEIMARSEPDADVTSFGVLTLVLFGGGFVSAVLARRRPGAGLIFCWSAGVTIFLVFFHAMQQWHPYGFRYFVLAAPWMAVVGAWWLDGLPRLARLAAWSVALLAGAGVWWNTTMHTHQSGWQAVRRPEHSRGYFVFGQWREWAAGLDEPAGPLFVALPDRRPLAAFYRQPVARHITLRPEPVATVGTAADFIGGEKGWVIVPATQFMGREGRVVARTWMFEGDELSPFSLAAYRKRHAGETAPPVLYRQRQTRPGTEILWDLLLKTWEQPEVRVQLVNPGGSGWRYRIITQAGQTGGYLAAKQTLVVTLNLPADAVSQVLVNFQPEAAAPAGPPYPLVELAR